MKAKLLIFAVTAVMMAFTACIKERIVYVEKESPTSGIELQPGEGIVKISLAEGMSRAARPVVSSESTSDINTIAFKFYPYDNTEDNSVIEGVYSDASGTTVPNGVNFAKGDNKITFSEKYEGGELYIKIGGLDASDEYQIIAYGYNSVNGELDVTRSGDYLQYDARAYQKQGENLPPVRDNHIDQEIFAGSIKTATNKYGLFKNDNISIVLTRQVAGLLAYMCDVPAFVKDDKGVNRKVSKIKIQTGVPVQGIKFPSTNDYNGCILGDDDNYRDVALLTFDVTSADDYENIKEYGTFLEFTNVGGYLRANEMPEIDSELGFKCDENTLFGGCFLCPFNSDQSGIVKETLKIVYYYTEGGSDKMIKSVALKTNDISFSDNPYAFNIRRNNFYSIGTKKRVDNPDSGKEGHEDDEPLPIDPNSGVDNFKVSLEEAWDIVHDITNITNEE